MNTETQDLTEDPNLQTGGEDDLELEGQETLPEKKEAPESEMAVAIRELKDVVRESKTPAKEKAAELTPEQKDEMWAVWSPTKSDPEFFRKFLRLNTEMEPAEVDKAVKEFQPIFKMMQEGMTKQAIVGARNLLQIEMSKLREELAPVHEHVSSNRAKELKADFDEGYPALSDKKFARVITAQAKLLEGQNFATKDEYFKALAEGAAETIQLVDPTFSLGQSTKTTKTQPGQSPRLPRTSAGGTGGAGAGAGSTTVKSKGGVATSDFLDED